MLSEKEKGAKAVSRRANENKSSQQVLNGLLQISPHRFFKNLFHIFIQILCIYVPVK
jgi:hypothetical protein